MFFFTHWLTINCIYYSAVLWYNLIIWLQSSICLKWWQFYLNLEIRINIRIHLSKVLISLFILNVQTLRILLGWNRFNVLDMAWMLFVKHLLMFAKVWPETIYINSSHCVIRTGNGTCVWRIPQLLVLPYTDIANKCH